ncbi:MAG: FtsQ-type POTRA domain-containing protein [Candidatus Aminicenantes bacterium]|nr:FtsQ-type POTRA domain-containing protein [Candidatus Aminicenantes bacterium]
MRAQPFSSPLTLPTYPYQRGSSRFRLRRVNKKTRLTLKHLIILFTLAGLLTYFFTRLLLFLSTWEGLRIENIQIKTEKPEVEREIRNNLRQVYFQNILKLDLKRIENVVLAHRWVKQAKVRKVFPNSLEIIIDERQPVAILKQRDQAYLIDEEGRKLEPGDDSSDLPVIYLSDEREGLSKEDLQLINDCLKSLTPQERVSVRIFLTFWPINLSLQFPSDPTLLILGKDHFQEKIDLYRRHRPWLEASFGSLEYLDLRFFEDRIYFKLREVDKTSETIDSEEDN